MATIRTNKSTSLILKVETGTSDSGSTVYANRTITNINPGLSDANAVDIGQALGELQTHPLNAVIRYDKATLVKEA